MPRMLIIATIPGTIQGFMLPFARHFRAKGWRVDAAAQKASANAGCIAEFDRVWDVQWSRRPLDLRNCLQAPKMIRNLVSCEDYDLVHVHTPIAAFVTRAALNGMRRTGRPRVVYTAHGFHFYRGGNPVKNRIFLSLEKMAGPWTDYLVVMNREDEEAARRRQLVSDDRLVYMPGIGVDTSHYSPASIEEAEIERVRQELQLAPEEHLLLMMAEFIPRKRHRDALAAFAALARRDCVLAFAGCGPLEEPMKRMATDLGVGERVRFLGFRRDAPALTRASTAVLLTSQQEGLPRSVMESLSLETPVVGSDIRGTRDLLCNGAGYLVKLGDIRGFAESMDKLLNDPAAAKEMGRLGREQMAAYDTGRIIQMHETLYETALAQ